MSLEKYHGMYVGIVVQNNDPENRGRVKVYVPRKWYTMIQLFCRLCTVGGKI